YASFASTEKGQQDILRGLNYASAGSGILNETSKNHLGEVISLAQQLQNHGKIVSEIMRIKGDKKSAADHLGQCIYTIGTGSSDYMNNYFLPVFYTTKNQYTPEQYATVLVQQYSQHLKDLYNYGARKIAIFGSGLIGCTPGSFEMDNTDEIKCVDSKNLVVKIFNDNLIRLVDELNNNLPGAKFICVNMFGISSTPIPGVTVIKTLCYE
ncbi:GDSL esterase/lipase At4g18970-like, partial [Pistacia vera]|uniref:GDSL esterase/lipase At4g18970-like n=1 Tax=Pistacia vera TaxID=55513 RepID=UPI0012639123